MASAKTDQNLQENNAGADDLHNCSGFLYTNGYCAIQNDLKSLYSSLQGFVVREEFKTHIQRDAFNTDNIEENLEQLKVDVMRTECPIVIAGETSSGKSSIINLILGEKILPSGIGASTSRVCRVKHSDCYEVSTKDRRGETFEKKMSFKNSKEMAETLQNLARTADDEISFVDIYMPVPMLQGNVMIVDTPGFGDQEQQGVAEKMMSYLPNALAFIFVLNVSNAGGIQDDRILLVLSKIKKLMAGMVSFSRKDVIFLLNKWDTISHEDDGRLENYFEETKEKLRKVWNDVDESRIFKMSAIKVSKNKPKYTRTFDRFRTTLKEVIAKNENKRVKVHLRYLNEFLEEFNRVLATKLKCANENAEENQKLFDDLSNELQKLEKTRKEVYVLNGCIIHMGVTELCITLSVLFCKGVPYENVGYNKSAWEHYPNNNREWGAERAVDGLYSDLSAAGGQCTISGNYQSTAEWRVDLGRIHIIHHIVIYYRTEHIDSDIINVYASRFVGFSVYVSNTTDKEDGILCFMDRNYTLETIPNPMNITCPNQESGKYVIYYNNRTHSPYPDGYSTYASNELCEMEVFSCPYGFFGKDCTDKCNDTCNGCSDVNGSCESGCHPGWFGNYCNKACAVGTYGLERREMCGNCRDVSQCLNTNGTCLADCNDGYQGDLCKTPCTLGWYGLECRDTCGNCRMCSNTNGSCLTACDAGYLGILCKSPCSEGFYGPDCKQKCGNCLDVNKCLHTTGQCLTGCDVGYQGALCKTPCDRGSYGNQCHEKCGRCRDLNQCFHITGVCLTGCDAGYEGSMCNATCRQGFFGKNCSHTCIKTCNVCNNVNGLCDSGCLLGWRGYFCSEFYGCTPTGYFGSNCSVPCPDVNCQECHMESGICHVCKQGYKGQRC